MRKSQLQNVISKIIFYYDDVIKLVIVFLFLQTCLIGTLGISHILAIVGTTISAHAHLIAIIFIRIVTSARSLNV